MQATSSGAPLSARKAWTVAIVATLVMSVSYIDRQALAALAPTVCKALVISDTQYGWLVASFSFAYLLGAPLAGALLDRVGARRGLVMAVLAWSAVAASHALVPTFGVFVALRVGLGLTEAPSFPGAAQSMRRVLPREHRSAGFGMLFTGSSVGGMLAVPLVIALNHWMGWRVAFLLTAAIGLSWIPVWLVATSDPHIKDVLARMPSAEDDPTATREPASRWSLLASPAVLRAVMLVCFSAPALMFGINWSSKYLAHEFALSQDALARYLWVPMVLFDLGAVGFGAIASRIDAGVLRANPAAERRSHVLLIVIGGVLGGTIAAVPLVHSPWLATGLISTTMAGGGALFALLTADMLARVHPSHVSTAAGLTASAQSLAYVVAGPLVGRAFDAAHSYSGVLLVLGAIVPPAALAWCVWPMPRSTK
jgi:ACS family hexuronate transporter-like MFS transporter